MSQGSIAFDRAADYYDDTRGFPIGQEAHCVKLFADAGHLSRGSRLLEIGIGTGRIALPLAPLVRSIAGVDISRPMMDKLRHKQRGEAIHVGEADAARLPFPNGAFDAVVAVHVFHLIPAWRDVLTEVARVLRPGGMLLHGWNARPAPQALEAIWQQQSRREHHTAGGVSWAQRETFLQDQGWVATSAPHSHPFTVSRSPRDYVQMIRQRKWSHCWQMTDEEIESGLATLEAHIAEHYADPSQGVEITSAFTVQGFLPPA